VSISSTSDTDEFSRIEFPQDNANHKVCSMCCVNFKYELVCIVLCVIEFVHNVYVYS